MGRLVNMTLERRISPEEEELQTKKAELDALLNQLAQKELDLETLCRDQYILLSL